VEGQSGRTITLWFEFNLLESIFVVRRTIFESECFDEKTSLASPIKPEGILEMYTSSESLF